MNVDTDFNLNPDRYEQQLSTFGKKVLSVLVKKWNREKNRNESFPRFRNMPAQGPWATPAPRTYNRKVLTFMNKEVPIQTSNSDLGNYTHFEVPDMEIVNFTHPQASRTLDSNDVITGPLHTHNNIPRSNELIHTLHGTPSSDSCVTAHGLLKTVNKNYFTENISVDTTIQKNLSEITKEANIDWHNMFDTELISDVTIDKIEINNNINADNTSTVVKKTRKTNNITANEEIPEKINKPFEMNTIEKQNGKKRKAQSKITDAVPKKVKKPASESKNIFRKQKYTTTVKNWLDNADPNHPNLVDRTPENTSETDKSKNSKIETVNEKDTLISTKKIVQTRLANKDGIMKFKKPKNFDSQVTGENINNVDQNITKANKTENIVDGIENITNIQQNTSDLKKKKYLENKSSVNKEKNIKRKFVTPIKSQIPVKDVNYNIIHVDANDSNDLSYDNVIDSDVLAVLVYSNGFSQLNKHNTEDTCEPAGLLFAIQEQFYYFKGFHQSFKNILEQLLENNKMICFDGKSILIYLKSHYNLDTHNFNIIDVKIGACILEPDSSVESFSELQKVLGFTPEFTVATECDLQKTAWYTTILGECAGNLMRLLTENDLSRVFLNIEMKLLPIIADMEHRGVEVDVNKLKSMEDTLLTKMRAVEQACYKAAGKAFQINSTAQVRTIIYEELKLDAKCNVKIRETIAQGAKSTSEAMLRSLTSVHPLPKLVLEYRHLHKGHATFLAGIAQHVRDGVVRPTWVQTAAVTGRIASNNPNLQAIPKTPFNLTLFPDRDASNETVLFRSVYPSPPEWTVLAADFRHVECRVWADVAADRHLRDALTAPDLFRQLARLWLKKAESEISREDRERTKRMVYATLYGAGCRKLMDILELGYEETLAVMASFNRTFPSLKSFGVGVAARCSLAAGEVRTASGRRRALAHISSSDAALRAHAQRRAVNFLVQGTAADLCKLAMVRTVERLRAARVACDLVLQIHDELVFHVRSEQLDRAAGIIKHAMEGCGREYGSGGGGDGGGGALPVQIAVGPNWGQITEYTPTT